MKVNKTNIDNIEVIKDEVGRIIKLLLKCGKFIEEYPIRYDKNGNVMRIGAEWMSFGGDLYIDEIIMSYSGKEFNQAVKQLVNSTYTYNTEDTKITTFNFTRKDNVNSTVIEKTDDGGIISIYLTGDILNIYTNARKIILPEDSSYMFYNFKSANYLDLSNFSSKNTTNMSHMFDSFASNADKITFTLGNNFDTSKVTTMRNMFYHFGLGVENNIKINLGGNFDSTSLTNADYMFEGFLREQVDSSNTSYLVDTNSFVGRDDDSNANIDTGSYVYGGLQQYLNCVCVDTDQTNDCNADALIGTFKETRFCTPKPYVSTIYDNKIYTHYGSSLKLLYDNFEFVKGYTWETNKQYIKDNGNRAYHDIKVTLGEEKSPLPIFTTFRAMVDFYMTAEIYDFGKIDESHCLVDGNGSYFFNKNGGLTRNTNDRKVRSVCDVTIDLGSKFTLNKNISQVYTFKTATFFKVNSETYKYLTDNPNNHGDNWSPSLHVECRPSDLN